MHIRWLRACGSLTANLFFGFWDKHTRSHHTHTHTHAPLARTHTHFSAHTHLFSTNIFVGAAAGRVAAAAHARDARFSAVLHTLCAYIMRDRTPLAAATAAATPFWILFSAHTRSIAIPMHRASALNCGPRFCFCCVGICKNAHVWFVRTLTHAHTHTCVH